MKIYKRKAFNCTLARSNLLTSVNIVINLKNANETPETVPTGDDVLVRTRVFLGAKLAAYDLLGLANSYLARGWAPSLIRGSPPLGLRVGALRGAAEEGDHAKISAWTEERSALRFTSLFSTG